MSKILTVFGATGSQGGSVIKAIHEHPTLSRTYKVRGVTRSLHSAVSRRLTAEGVDMVQADLNEAESVYRAILGSHAVFAMTNFWEYRSAEVEFAQGKAIADACKKAEIECLIWSTLSHATTVSGGRLRSIHHFDSKADVETYIRSIHVPASFVNPGCFMSNLKTMLTKTDDGSYKLTLPVPSTTEIPMIDEANDTGKWVVSILSKPSEALGEHFLEAAGWYTVDDICAIFAEVTGKQILFQQASESAFAASNDEEVCEAWILLRDYAYFGSDAKVRLQASLEPPTGSCLEACSFNFAIPQSYTGTCSLIFLFPEQSQLETSSYSFSGNGVVDFKQLDTIATSQTTYSSIGGVKTDFGDKTVTPGSSTVVSTFSCPAWKTVSYELSSVSGTSLNYFQDYNPSPIGLYTTTC